MACSIAVSTISANGFVGGPGWCYTSGMIAVMNQFMIPIVLVVACNYVVPFMYNLKVTSCYEYIEKRFGTKTHLLSTIGYLAAAAALLSGFVYIPSLFVQKVTGWSLVVIVPIIVVVVILYTMAGGLKAVVWTDAVQIVVLWGGLFGVIWFGLSMQGLTFADVFNNARESGMLNALDFSADLGLENGFWVAVFGGAAMWLQYFAADQTQLQRMIAAKSIRSVKTSIVTGGIMTNVLYFLFMIVGLILISFYGGRTFESSNDVMIIYILEEIPAGLLGLIIAAVFAAAMSSIDSVLNSMTTVFIKDIYEKHISKDGREASVKLSTAFTGLFGVITIIIVLLGFSGTTSSVLATVGSYAGYVAGSLLSVFLLAMFTEKANDLGTAIGFIAGLAVTCAVSFTSVNWLWYYLVGAVVSYVVGYVASCFVGKNKEGVHELTIRGQREAMIAKGTTEEGGVSLLPGKMDKYAWILIGFFVIQVIVLIFFTKS